MVCIMHSRRNRRSSKLRARATLGRKKGTLAWVARLSVASRRHVVNAVLAAVLRKNRVCAPGFRWRYAGLAQRAAQSLRLRLQRFYRAPDSGSAQSKSPRLFLYYISAAGVVKGKIFRKIKVVRSVRNVLTYAGLHFALRDHYFWLMLSDIQCQCHR